MKILIINGHPDTESFCHSMAESYKTGAEKSGAGCKLIHLTDLKFNPILQYGYRTRTELEPDLIQAQKDIKEADHLVFIFPVWWSTYPALLKGFIDRVFLPGFAFKYRDNSILWDKLLKGKSASIISTMDTPGWYYRLVYKSPAHNSLKKGILEFCGISPVHVTRISPVKTSDSVSRAKWLKKVEALGEKFK